MARSLGLSTTHLLPQRSQLPLQPRPQAASHALPPQLAPPLQRPVAGPALHGTQSLRLPACCAAAPLPVVHLPAAAAAVAAPRLSPPLGMLLEFVSASCLAAGCADAPPPPLEMNCPARNRFRYVYYHADCYNGDA
ncbi:hypothetical protein Vafri_2170 [Volvox africanus]|nr:hypothetical protein Vafri_2170 [Volvox africanus]